MSKLHQQILVSLSLIGVSFGQIFTIPLMSQQGKAVASSVPQNIVSTIVAQEVGTTDGAKSFSKQHLLARTNSVLSPNLPSQKSTQVSQSQSQSWESGVQTSFNTSSSFRYPCSCVADAFARFFTGLTTVISS